MSFLDYTEPGVFALGGGLLDVEVNSPAAAVCGLVPGITGSAAIGNTGSDIGGFPSNLGGFPGPSFLNSRNTGNGLFDLGDPLLHAASSLDSARGDMLTNHAPLQQHQQQLHQQSYLDPSHVGGITLPGFNPPMVALPNGQWRPGAYPNPIDSARQGSPSPAPSSINSLTGSNTSSLAPERACLVCSDEALGRHFGVLTCEACKSFFRRSVRTSAQYFCRYNRNCHVVKQSRNKCQYCRYQKCLRVGMQPEAVQEERNPGGGKSGSTSTVKDEDAPVSPVSSSQPPPSSASVSMAASSPPSPWGMAAAVPADTRNITTLLCARPADDAAAPKQLNLPALLDAERAWESDQQPKDPITTPASFADIVDATRSQLNFAIDWAKLVPPFPTLMLDDQVLVMKSVWNELLTIQLAFRASRYENTLMLGTGQLLYRDQGDPDIRRIVGRFIDEIVSPCKAMGLEMAELVCMKAIVLFNPDCPKLTNPKAVEELQDQCMVILSEYCHARFPEQNLRFSKILLRLSAVRSITTETKDYIIQHHHNSNLQIDRFVLDMLGIEKHESSTPATPATPPTPATPQ